MLPAGDFAEWLSGREASLRSDNHHAAVPCGTCNACCRSSMFIHIKPDETETLKRIPRALLFPAHGRPKGHVLMGYKDDGCCPMLVDNACSIYEFRPQTCREYDCRVFAATGVAVDRATQADVAARVDEWAFQHETESSRAAHESMRDAAAFLQQHADLLPPGSVPSHPVQLAGLALRIYRVFDEARALAQENPSTAPATVIAAALTKALLELKTET